MERVAKQVNLKEQVVDFPPQPVITKDNVTMRIDTVVFFQITDPRLFSYGVESPIMAIENLTATTLRNIIGEMELDETLTSREIINTKMRAALDIATDPWGIKVNRVELKNIMPPAAIQEAMEKQMKADSDRGRREKIYDIGGRGKKSLRHSRCGGGEAGADPAGRGGKRKDDQGGGRRGGGHFESAAGQRRRNPDAEGSGR